MSVRRALRRLAFPMVMSVAFLALSILPLPEASAAEEAAARLDPEVRYAVRHDVSAPLTNLVAAAEPRLPEAGLKPIENRILPKAMKEDDAAAAELAVDPVVQGAAAAPFLQPSVSFEGINNRNGVLPPDTNGDVGPNHYIQWVNLSLAVYDKNTGTALLGPFNGNVIFSGLGGPCETFNDGDPIVLYDHLADRWFISQFALPGFSGAGGFHQCIAVSAGPDPLGAWYRYDFLYSNTLLNDYPKFGVWPDGYYMSVNQFQAPFFFFAGAGVVAFERDAMLRGQAARVVSFNLRPVNPCFGGMLPTDLDGPPPPPGAPNYFVEVDDTTGAPCNFPTDALRVWQFAVDWTAPVNSTFGIAGQPNHVVDVADFSFLPCVLTGSRDCIPQPPPAGATSRLDSLGDRLMHRAQYRNFGTHESIVMNHTVDAGGGRAGLRWYELRDPGGAPGIHQQGTYAPADTEHRWMGSVAMDGQGNIGLGYSVSSATVFPSIRMTARLVGDPPGTLRDETFLFTGTGSQTHPASRWGDYSMTSVDPADDCAFYHTNEYLQVSGSAPWRTRIDGVAVPDCVGTPSGVLEGRITEKSSGFPVPGADVTAGVYSVKTDHTGFYRFYRLPAATYTVTASKYGYTPFSRSGVLVGDGETSTVNGKLKRNAVFLGGLVRDGSGHGWPLYARVTVSGGGHPGLPVYTHPPTGAYVVDLMPGNTYTITVESVFPGYQPQMITVTPTWHGIRNFSLVIDASCNEDLGYAFTAYALDEPFTSSTLPSGWTTVAHAPTTRTWRFNRWPARPNFTGGSGNMAIADSDFEGLVDMDTSLATPAIDATPLGSTVYLEYKSDFRRYAPAPEEVCDTDVSRDGGATWTNVLRRSGADFRGPRTEAVDISGVAAGQSNVRVRFHYYNAFFDWWWEVDEARVRNNTCGKVTGGLVEGVVRDAATGRPITGALVSHDGTPPGSTTAVATPWDGLIPDAGYILFTPGTAPVNFTVSAPGYTTQTAPVTPRPDRIVLRNWQLECAAPGTCP